MTAEAHTALVVTLKDGPATFPELVSMNPDLTPRQVWDALVAASSVGLIELVEVPSRGKASRPRYRLTRAVRP